MFRNFAKKSRGEKVFTVLNYLFLSLLTIIIIYPFVYVVFASFSDPFEIMSSRGLLLKPKGFSLESYKVVFHNPNIWKGYLNTLFILVFGTGINILLTSFAAYALSRPDFKAGSKIMVLIVFTMMFNGGIIPTYIPVSYTHLFRLDLMKKDIGLYRETAEREKAFSPLSAMVYELYKAVSNQGGGDRNYTYIMKWMEENQRRDI